VMNTLIVHVYTVSGKMRRWGRGLKGLLFLSSKL